VNIHEDRIDYTADLSDKLHTHLSVTTFQETPVISKKPTQNYSDGIKFLFRQMVKYI